MRQANLKRTNYMPQVFRELAVFNSLDYKFANDLYPAFGAIVSINAHDACVSTLSATNLSLIPANSIDYIFTGPPYAENVQCAAARSALTDDGRPPLAASGLTPRDRLSKVADSLDRAGAKRGSRRS